jgi:hypothetical protein
MPRTTAPALSTIELQHVANRLDNGGDCSRHESMRLLATIRELQAWASEARPWVQDAKLRTAVNEIVPPRKRKEDGQ